MGTLNISASSIISSILFGVIGMWMFPQGKKKQSISITITAILLMFYPYFTSGPLADWGVGIALCTFAYFEWNK